MMLNDDDDGGGGGIGVGFGVGFVVVGGGNDHMIDCFFG